MDLCTRSPQADANNIIIVHQAEEEEVHCSGITEISDFCSFFRRCGRIYWSFHWWVSLRQLRSNMLRHPVARCQYKAASVRTTLW